ncbi:SDR family oxidoreductase [Streptosporangium saharense]|uniref:SDR family oxidoreductase n=1 Tax=Streptosporangium saharense TaxID=1706840 RepID=UPI0036A7EB5A
MIVVTGATGNVGRPLVRLLSQAGERVTAVSRKITASDVPEGVTALAADLADPAALRPALEGADALFLLVGGDLIAATDDAGAVVGDLLADAVAAGVRRVVLLSSLGVVTRPDSLSHGLLGKSIEDAVLRSGLDWTILRPSGFASNAYAHAEPVRALRTVAAPFGDVGLPLVDPDDIAEVAAAALLQDGHAGRSYELTGPALVTPRQQAEAIGAAIGEAVRFTELTGEEALARMLTFMPEPVAETTLDIIGRPTPAELRVSPDVEHVLGRPANPFAAWAERNAMAFR